MQGLIEKTIVAEAKKRLRRYSQKQYYLHKYRKSFQKRTGVKGKTALHALPSSWSFHKHFDPRYCINHAKFLAKGVWTSLQNGTYEPNPALRVKHAKPTGGTRSIDVFSVPDAAVAAIFFSNLRKRNAKLFSDSSFAYQEGKTPLDAVIKLRSLLRREKVFISQYDFSKFFDSIDHSFIDEILTIGGPFLTTIMERQVLGSVVRHQYQENGTLSARNVGTPQGNSVSLFVANIAAHPLDLELSSLNGSFARFADDCVVVNYSYEDAVRCAEVFFKYSKVSGIQINRAKSSGIRLFSESPSEMASINHFDFLSYEFTPRGLRISAKSLRAIKRRCARIIFNHLLLHPRRAKSIAANRVGRGFYDWDLVTCVNELRRFIYGGLSQAVIDAYLAGARNVTNFSGAVSYFCLADQSDQVRSLDGWLANILHRALRERRRMERFSKVPTL
ncbi:reverse transcriptase domain-containing protein [Mesorhizobium sp. L-8-10]|uniref:reverse transcriptase domain-containing protein n=1 Tax=Mesorhizobium sp. L-8-10 TaxID=2744523 RepID=UPI001925B5A6|nr:reverse transcriptase domain-containing protein [Mesorhizobium sp. L-8-10]